MKPKEKGDGRLGHSERNGDNRGRDELADDSSNNNDYIFRKRKGGRIQNPENSAVEKFNLRIKHRIDRDRKNELRQREADPYDHIDVYSPERLKTTRNTRALTKKLNKVS